MQVLASRESLVESIEESESDDAILMSQVIPIQFSVLIRYKKLIPNKITSYFSLPQSFIKISSLKYLKKHGTFLSILGLETSKV